MTKDVRIGAWAGFWGDSPQAARMLLERCELDYLVSDHLAEVTMALLARARAKDPESGGYIAEVVTVLAPLLSTIAERGIRVVTNAGALNPAGMAHALRAAAAEAGVELRVAAVLGDDLSMRVGELRDAGLTDMFTGEAIPEAVLTCNAYLGAFPVAEALAAGADIVVTGRATDSAMTLGPLIHEFGWNDDDHDLLSAGTLVGHLVECGPQTLGGLYSDWFDVPGWDDMGYPVAIVSADGSAVITKPEGTGGLVVPGSVGEQLLYEIGDPGAYVVPDVVCDWREVRMEQDGPDRVRVTGARGTAPTTTYKATTTVLDGFRVMASAMFAGRGAAGRARRAGEAIVARAERAATAAGIAPLEHVSIEVVGGGDVVAQPEAHPVAREAVVKIGARHPDRRALDAIAAELSSFALIAQGMTGLLGGRPKPSPNVRLVHLLVPKAELPVTIDLGDETIEVAIAPGAPDAVVATAPLPEPDAAPAGRDDVVTVPLYRVALARSGDKGNRANLGVLARRPELVDVVVEQVTAARVRAWFPAWELGAITRWALPGLGAINVLCEDALGGQGGTSSLRYDALGKSMGATLLEMPIEVPAAFARDGLLAPED